MEDGQSKLQYNSTRIRFSDIVFTERRWVDLSTKLFIAPEGKNWRMLGDYLGYISDELDCFEKKNSTKTPARMMLEEWQHTSNAFVDVVLDATKQMDNYTVLNMIENWVLEYIQSVEEKERKKLAEEEQLKREKTQEGKQSPLNNFMGRSKTPNQDKSLDHKMSHSWILTKLFNKFMGMVQGITVDNNGNIYFTTNNENVYLIRKDNINTEPQILVKIKGTRSQRAVLCGIVWSGNNVLYICDVTNYRILSYSIDTGSISTLAGTGEYGGYKDGNIQDAQFRNPQGIAMDRNGDLYITDYHHVRKINLSEGTVITIAGSTTAFSREYQDGEAKNAKLSGPYGIIVSDDDTIYVADRDNHCIRKIKDAIVSTIAGIPLEEGNQDGSLSDSQFACPSGLILDGDGNLLVGDYNGMRIVDMNQKVVTTLSQGTCKEIYSLATDSLGQVYVGGNSLYKLNRPENKQ